MFGDQFIAILSDGTKILYNFIQKTFIMYNSGPVIFLQYKSIVKTYTIDNLGKKYSNSVKKQFY